MSTGIVRTLSWALLSTASCAGSNRGEPVHAHRTWSIDVSAPPFASEARTERLSEQQLHETDREFIETAAVQEIRHITLARIALRRSLRADVRQLAWRMVGDHLQIDRELSSLARARGVELPTERDEQARAELAELVRTGGESFDRRYLDVILADQRVAKELFAAQAERGQDPALREWAGRTLLKIQSHLEQAEIVRSGGAGPVSRRPTFRLASTAPTPAAPSPDECFVARAVAIYQGFGWTHFVDVASVCARAMACLVATDVDPEPRYTVSVPPGEVVRVRTRYGSNTDQFRPLVQCSFARVARSHTSDAAVGVAIDDVMNTAYSSRSRAHIARDRCAEARAVRAPS